MLGLRDAHSPVINEQGSRTGLERPVTAGNSPVDETKLTGERIPSTTGHVKSRGNQGGPPSKAKHT